MSEQKTREEALVFEVISSHACKCGFDDKAISVTGEEYGVCKWKGSGNLVTWSEMALAICPLCGEECMEVEEEL